MLILRCGRRSALSAASFMDVNGDGPTQAECAPIFCTDIADKCQAYFSYVFVGSGCNPNTRYGNLGTSCGTQVSFVARDGNGNGATIDLSCSECLWWDF